MRVLVTGASGYVAKHVIADLSRDHDLLLISRRHPDETPRGPKVSAEFMRGDLLDLNDCRQAVEGVDAVVHIGANPWLSPDTFRNNIMATYNLLEAMSEMEVSRMVFASSNCALGHCAPISGAFIPDSLPITESHASRVEDSYGLSKLINEQTLEAYARGHSIESYALRLAWCWGDAEREWREDQPFNPADHRGGFWAYVDMRDVVQAFRKALQAPPNKRAMCQVLYINAADTMAEEPSLELAERYFPQLSLIASRLRGRESFFSWRAAYEAIGYEPQHSWME